MSKKLTLYLLPPVLLVAVFMIIDFVSGQHNLWMSAVATLAWLLFSFASEHLTKGWQKAVFLTCVGFLLLVAGLCIYIKLNP